MAIRSDISPVSDADVMNVMRQQAKPAAAGQARYSNFGDPGSWQTGGGAVNDPVTGMIKSTGAYFQRGNESVVSDELFWNPNSPTGAALQQKIADAQAQGQRAGIVITPYAVFQGKATNEQLLNEVANSGADFVALDPYLGWGVPADQLYNWTKDFIPQLNALNKEVKLVTQGFAKKGEEDATKEYNRLLQALPGVSEFVNFGLEDWFPEGSEEAKQLFGESSEWTPLDNDYGEGPPRDKTIGKVEGEELPSTVTPTPSFTPETTRTSGVEQPTDPNQVYYDSEQGYFTTVAIERQLESFRRQYPNASVAPILVQTTTSEGDYVPTNQLEKIDIVQGTDRPGVFSRIQLDPSGTELGRTQFQQQGFFQSPVFGILVSAVVPMLGEYIASALSASGAIAAETATTVGNALAKISVDVAAGKSLDDAVRDVAISTAIQTGSTDVGKAIAEVIKDPQVANAVVSAGTSAVQTAAKGGDANEIFRAAVAGAGGSVAGGAAGQRIPGEVVKTLIATGDPGAAVGAAISGLPGAISATRPSGAAPGAPKTAIESLGLEDVQQRLAQLGGEPGGFAPTTTAAEADLAKEITALAEGGDKEAFANIIPLLLMRGPQYLQSLGNQIASVANQLAATPAGQNALRYAAQNSEQVRAALVNTGFLTAGALYMFTAGQPLDQARIAGQFFDTLTDQGRDRAQIPTGAPGLTPPTAPPTGVPGREAITTGVPGAAAPGEVPDIGVPGKQPTPTMPGVPGRAPDTTQLGGLTFFTPPAAPAGGEGGGEAGGTVTGGEIATGDTAAPNVNDIIDAIRRQTLPVPAGPAAGAGSPEPGGQTFLDQLYTAIGVKPPKTGAATPTTPGVAPTTPEVAPTTPTTQVTPAPSTADAQRLADLLQIPTEVAGSLLAANPEVYGSLIGGSTTGFTPADIERMRSTDIRLAEAEAREAAATTGGGTTVTPATTPATTTTTTAAPTTTPEVGIVLAVNPATSVALVIDTKGQTQVVPATATTTVGSTVTLPEVGTKPATATTTTAPATETVPATATATTTAPATTTTPATTATTATTPGATTATTPTTTTTTATTPSTVTDTTAGTPPITPTVPTTTATAPAAPATTPLITPAEVTDVTATVPGGPTPPGLPPGLPPTEPTAPTEIPPETPPIEPTPPTEPSAPTLGPTDETTSRMLDLILSESRPTPPTSTPPAAPPTPRQPRAETPETAAPGLTASQPYVARVSTGARSPGSSAFGGRLRSPLEQALSAYTPPGEIEYGTLGPRRDVWNEASLRLKDALGL